MLLVDDVFMLVYYVLIYFTLFVSVFWFAVFFDKRSRILKDPKPMRRLPSISILIPAFNEERGIAKTLDSVIGQDYPKGKLDVIVIDDASTDRTAEIVEGYVKTHSNVKLVRHRENRKKAAALNTGLKHVKTEVVGFVDSDSVIGAGALKNMVGYLGEGSAGVIAAIKPKRSETFSQKLQNVEYIFAAIIRKLTSFLGALYLTPAFALYKTSVLKKVGGFDEKNFSEDLEMGLRLQSRGYRIENSMNAEVITETPASLGKLLSQRIRWNRGFIYNSRKYARMFFNPKFRDLGLFVLPSQYIALALTTTVFLYGIYVSLAEMVRNITNFYLIGFDVPYSLAHITTPSFSSFGMLMLAILATGTILLVKLGSKYMDKKVSRVEYLIYIPLYPIMFMVFWLFTLYHEIRRSERVW